MNIKILFINGSPEEDGVIANAFNRMAFNSQCEYKIVNIPKQITNCINCRLCKKNKDFVCDIFVKEMTELIKSYDAIILGSPVYYGGITSQMKSFLTKLFYSNPKACNYKPIGLVVSSRRAGSVMALSEFALPFLMHSNIIVGSSYWNEIYGDTYDETEYDYEGLQTLDNLIKNIKYVALGLHQIEKPINEPLKHLNFISREYLEQERNK